MYVAARVWIVARWQSQLALNGLCCHPCAVMGQLGQVCCNLRPGFVIHHSVKEGLQLQKCCNGHVAQTMKARRCRLWFMMSAVILCSSGHRWAGTCL